MSHKVIKKIIAEEESLILSVRRAEDKDIDALVEICQRSFPKLVRWQIPRFLSRKRWRHILSSTVTETWVCSVNSRLAGYVTLVRDISVFRLEKHRYDRFVFKKIYCYLLCPRLFLQMLTKKMHAFIPRSVKSGPLRQSRTDLMNCIWIDSIAVNPEMRRNGIATRLLKLCYKRTVQLKMDGMKLAVEPDNIAAHNLYEGFGFHCTSQGDDTHIYTMKVKKENASDRIKAIG